MSTISTKMLDYYVDFFNKQKDDNSYPNSHILCGIITPDKDKAKRIMKKKGAVIEKCSQNYIRWTLNNERWIWYNPNVNSITYRFCKVLVDREIDAEVFFHVLLPCTYNCFSMEII